MKRLTVIIIGIFFISFFNLSCNSKKIMQKSDSILLGMILLEEPNSMNINNVIEELKGRWNLKVKGKESKDETTILNIDGYSVVISNLSVPIPGDDIDSTAKYNYFWKNGVEEATKHKGHIIISIMNAGQNPVKENLLFSKVASSILKNSKSLGIYLGGRSLLLKKDFYLENTELMTDNDLPLFDWIYFGMRQIDGKQSIYTYGLFDFNKKEMEIINSSHSLKELRNLMFDLVHYVILSDAILKNGETIGVTADQKLKITESDGVYLDGKTLKIEY